MKINFEDFRFPRKKMAQRQGLDSSTENSVGSCRQWHTVVKIESDA